MSAPHLRLSALAAIALAGGLVLSGCAGAAAPESSGSQDAAASDGFPVTFEHIYGETTLDEAPERIATWGWGATDRTSSTCRSQSSNSTSSSRSSSTWLIAR